MKLGPDHAAALLAAVPDGVLVLGPDGGVREVNESFVALSGFEADACVGAAPPHPWWPDEPEGRPHAGVDATLLRADGRRVPVRVVDRSVGPGGSGGCVRVVRDMRPGRAAQDRARRSASRAAEQAALRRVAVASAEGDPRGVLELAAREVAGLVGAPSGAVCRFEGDEAHVVGGHGSAPQVAAGARLPLGAGALARVARTGRPAREAAVAAAPVRVEGRLWGAVLAMAGSGAPLPAGAHIRLERVAEVVAVGVGAADARARLAAQAVTDSLTGLADHRAFHERLRAEVARARRHDRPLSLVLLDIDHFKRLNDVHGHQAGDRALIEVGARLLEIARGGDLVARVGGEEFAWILPETEGARALDAAERARRRVSETPLGVSERVTISAGVCDLGSAADGDELFRLADRALYWAKAHGRDLACRYTPEVVDSLSPEERAMHVERGQALAALRALARAVDGRHGSTHAHSERVGGLAARIALSMGWSVDAAAALREAGALHDVGKIGVPDSLLTGPTPAEGPDLDRLRAHAALGAEIAGDALSPEQRTWIRAHHERYDGEGYPDGLSATAIPEGARILAVADAWDVVCCARAAEGVEDVTAVALAELRRAAGAQFCPRVVAALQGLMDDATLPASSRGAAP